MENTLIRNNDWSYERWHGTKGRLAYSDEEKWTAQRPYWICLEDFRKNKDMWIQHLRKNHDWFTRSSEKDLMTISVKAKLLLEVLTRQEDEKAEGR